MLSKIGFSINIGFLKKITFLIVEACKFVGLEIIIKSISFGVSFISNIFFTFSNVAEFLFDLKAKNKESGNKAEIADICFFAIEPNPIIKIFKI